MKRYRRKEEVFVWQWTGDKSIIPEIGKMLERYRGLLSIGISSSDPNIMYIKQDIGNQVGSTWGNEFIRLGDYIVFDINNFETPLRCYDEKYLNKQYVEVI